MALGLALKQSTEKGMSNEKRVGRKSRSLGVSDDVKDKRYAELAESLGARQCDKMNQVDEELPQLNECTLAIHDKWFSTSSRNLMTGTPTLDKRSPPRRAHRRTDSDATATSTQSACSFEETRLQAAKEFGIMVAKNKRLPTACPGFFCSNHVLVNQERTAFHIPALIRLIELDALAREFAEAMAMTGRVEACGLYDVEERILPCNSFGVNVARGSSVQGIHEKMLINPSERSRMIDRRYTHMGMGTALGKNGKIYLCQIFKG